MALDKADIEYLLRERGWYLERMAQVQAGTYGVERRERGEVMDDQYETGKRFAEIVHSIDQILELEGIDPDA